MGKKNGSRFPVQCAHIEPPLAPEHLLPLVYDQLRDLAATYMRRERSNHTLQPTALVHEAYVRLVEQHPMQWSSRAHFFAIAARTVRRVLIDHSRYKKAAKRGHDSYRMNLTDIAGVGGKDEHPKTVDLLALDEALVLLAWLYPRPAAIVEMRYFGGLSNVEIAHVLGISRKTVHQELSLAKAWLSRALSEGAADESEAGEAAR